MPYSVIGYVYNLIYISCYLCLIYTSHTAYIINITRGKVINDRALAKALRENWIAGAALDAFAEEPLPSSSELWDLPKTLITPHVSGDTDRHNDRNADIFCENLRLYLNGEKHINIVDIARGY